MSNSGTAERRELDTRAGDIRTGEVSQTDIYLGYIYVAVWK